jgi:hypothetical protein
MASLLWPRMVVSCHGRPPGGLVAQIGEEHLRHGAKQTDMHGGDRADIDGVQAEAQELQLVEHGSDIRQPSGQAVQSLDRAPGCRSYRWAVSGWLGWQYP